MKNRAKCRKCKDIIESFFDGDYVNCNCGEISVSGGDKMLCGAIDWKNFIRIDDLGNEVMVKVEEDVKPLDNEKCPVTQDEVLKHIDEMIARLDEMPSNAKSMPINHYDMISVLLLLSSALRSLRN